MQEPIKHLLSLQERDLGLDRLMTDLAAVPKEIAAIKKQIEEARALLEASKKELTQLQLARKEKEVDLETKEGAIRKHSTELNAVKTNEAYRALLGEIEKAKSEKSVLEDSILQLMDQIDQAGRTWKEREANAKQSEGERLRQISDWEAKQKDLEQEITQKEADRDQLANGFPKVLLDPYQRLRKNKRDAVVVPIKGVQCSGCHMSVSQNLLNEIRRGVKLIACESCSRIVYLEEAPTAASAQMSEEASK